MALSDYSAADQQIIRTVIGAEGAAPSNEELVQYQAYVAANSINALSNLLIAEDAALLTTEALADQIVANFGAIEATGVKDQATAYVLGRLNKEGADVGAIIAQIATVLGDPDLSANLNPIYLPLAATFQVTTEAGLASSAVETFTLTTGLAAVTAADAAVAAYIAANATDVDLDLDIDAADIAAAQAAVNVVLDAADDVTGTAVAAATAYTQANYLAASTAIRAQMVTEAEAANAATLAALVVTETAAQAAVTAVTGLQGAVNNENADQAADTAAGLVVTAAAAALAMEVAAYEAGTGNGTVTVSGAAFIDDAIVTGSVLTPAGGAQKEEYAITLGAMVEGESVTIDGVTLTAPVGGYTANAAAAAFVALADGALFVITAAGGAVVTATTVAAVNVDVTDVVISTSGTEASNPGISDLEAAIAANVAAVAAKVVTAADLVTSTAVVEGLDTGHTLFNALSVAAAAVDTHETTVDDALAAAVAAETAALAAVTAATVITDGLAAVNLVATDAQAAVDALFDTTYDPAVTTSDATKDDLYMADSLAAGAAFAIANFGQGTDDADDADDTIYLGAAVLNSGVSATDGDNAVLEYFITEVAGDTVIQIETSVFGSNTAAQAETATITLTGVANDEIVIVDGQLTLA